MNKQLEVGSYVEFETGRTYDKPQILQCLVIATEAMEPMYEGDDATTLYDVAMYDDSRKLGYVYRTMFVDLHSILGLYDGVRKSERHATGAEREQVIVAGIEKELGLMHGDISSLEEGERLLAAAKADAMEGHLSVIQNALMDYCQCGISGDKEAQAEVDAAYRAVSDALKK